MISLLGIQDDGFGKEVVAHVLQKPQRLGKKGIIKKLLVEGGN
jgi:hypothetical protein